MLAVENIDDFKTYQMNVQSPKFSPSDLRNIQHPYFYLKANHQSFLPQIIQMTKFTTNVFHYTIRILTVVTLSGPHG